MAGDISIPVYVIRDWERLYENAQSRKCKQLSWVPMPNKHDGKGYRRLMKLKDGAAIYGAWCLIVQVASKCPTRGELVDDAGSPLLAEDLSDKTGVKSEIFERAFQVLSDKSIGWILVARYQSATSCYERSGLNGMERTEGNRTEGKEDSLPPSDSDDKPPAAALLTFPCCGNKKTWELTDWHVSKWQAAFESLNILDECKRALAWVDANSKNKKTAVGMEKFLVSWFNRSVERGVGRRSGSQSDEMTIEELLDIK